MQIGSLEGSSLKCKVLNFFVLVKFTLLNPVYDRTNKIVQGRSVTSQRFKIFVKLFGWHIQKEQDEKKPICQKSALGRYKHCYAPMTQALWKREA